MNEAFIIAGKDGMVSKVSGGWVNPDEANPVSYLYERRKDAEDRINWAEHYKNSTSFDPDRDPGTMARSFLAYEPKVKTVEIFLSIVD